MSIRSVIVILSILLVITSCGESHKERQSADMRPTADTCMLTVIDTTIDLKWTAFKTSDRLGVDGTFDIVQISGLKNARSVREIIENASFEIPVSSVNSQNPDRDKKIFVHFFSNMNNTGLLAGQVLSVIDNKCEVGLVMNDVRDTVQFQLEETDNRFALKGSIDLTMWNGLQSINALNKVCYDLHKGSDGISRLWSDVNLEISASVKSDCN